MTKDTMNSIPKSPLYLGNQAMRKGDYVGAIKYYEEALRLMPEIKSIEQNLALARDKQFKYILKESPKKSATYSHEVVVCVHNAPEDVRLCIDSLIHHFDGVQSIVIVDDQSDRKTVELLENYANKHQSWIKVYRTSERSGYTKAANFGLSKTKADLVTLLNSDTIVTKSWASRLRSHFERFPALGIVGPLSNAASYQSVPGIVGTETQTAINELPPGVTPDQLAAYCANSFGVDDMPFVPLVHGFCFTVSRACLNKLTEFDEEKFPRGYGEETDFCLRAQDQGFALGIALNTYVFHAKSKSYSDTERVNLMQEGWNALVKKYSKNRLVDAIKVMENQPALQLVRQSVSHNFYDKKNNNLIFSTRRGELLNGKSGVGALAFYLPQFHPTPENDLNWGKGFTEWTNVTRSLPRFEGHYQPKLPTELGFYDLRLPEIMTQQAELAAIYGIKGFCFYYYRFGAKRMLDTPLRIYRDNLKAEMPYCYCWANESWTRAWDGKTSEVLFEQTYGNETFNGIVNDLTSAISDDRYIRIGGRPVFLVYQAAKIPEPKSFISRLREALHQKTKTNFLIGTVYSPDFQESLMDVVDFVVQFPPHRIPRSWSRVTIPRNEVNPYQVEREDYYESYDEIISGALKSCSLLSRMFPGVCPDWDNSARRQRNATTVIGSTPEKFSDWVKKAAHISQRKFQSNDLPLPLIFVNAWNEWAEGATLEPSDRYGRAYLEALHAGLTVDAQVRGTIL